MTVVVTWLFYLGNDTKDQINMNTCEARQKNASERVIARKKLSNKEQLAILDKRLGVGIGAIKERKRLSK